ncbi:hypothetical protein [Azotobacter chroococcum]|uniref:Uncharacterized protein n=1 Tax=Azotobacter chroococcum TaxID=353 RepID=A0AAP9YJZ8_9GAMM|nr:hypothetical protein [Azotobacter chroococcum]QQE91282.1 hypothetical protein GKQ51_22655 [Azotobacter chroococcum]
MAASTISASFRLAAACYALFAQRQVLGLRKSEPDHAWPWNLRWWKPGDARSALVKAGALILAEIEPLDHQEQKATHV